MAAVYGGDPCLFLGDPDPGRWAVRYRALTPAIRLLADLHQLPPRYADGPRRVR